MTGGPRGGSGAAVRAAMCAAGMGSRACASGCTSGSRVCNIGGGAPMCTHNGQSSVWLGMSCAPSSVLTTSLTAPDPRQINSTGLGWTKGDATATPIDNTNHASTRRASHRRLRRVCRGRGGMWRDCRRPLRRAGYTFSFHDPGQLRDARFAHGLLGCGNTRAPFFYNLQETTPC